MRILIIRHAEPDYAIDGLTEKGRREAELLSQKLVGEQIAAAYCSTMGRARLTAAPTLEKKGMEAMYCEWLREFNYAKVNYPYLDKPHLAWDVLPSYMEQQPMLYSSTAWREAEVLRDSEMPQLYDEVCGELDRVLANHGYVREGLSYRVTHSNHDTIALFCHFGVTAVLLSHLMNCSPYTLWQNTVTLPSSVTTVYTEEREEGIAHFRCAGLGDLSHLYVAGEEPSFMARWCECFGDETRH
ncbi:MAG: histidine phosphatase family protein [Clostridia bacterium]|nr:histidine phosphatase family protein [Clostridia bacterium]